MFYTIASKIPQIESDRSNRKILKIFVIGSVFYVLLHYYLFSSSMGDFVEKIKQYFYYIIPCDLATAYFMSSLSNKNTEPTYTPEELHAMRVQNMLRAKAYNEEMQKRMMMMNGSGGNNSGGNNSSTETCVNNESNNNSDVPKSPFKKADVETDTPVKKNNSIVQKDIQKDIQKDASKTTKKQADDSDTFIEPYVGK